MRSIGHLSDESHARAFSDYLYVEGIANDIEHERDNEWTVWVHDEHELDRAMDLLAQFRANPDDPKYKASARAAAELKERTQQEEAVWRKKLRNRRHLFRPLIDYRFGPLSFVLICLSAVVFFRSEFAEKPENIMFLFITNFEIQDHSIVWLRGLPEIRDGEVWRLFTPMLIHWSFLHILLNMLWLRDLGSMVEGRQSTWQLLLLVLVFSGTSNFAQYLVSGPAFGGMSGVVYGLLGYVWIRGKLDPASGLFLHPTTVVMMLVWFFVCLVGVVGNIANTAHGVGLVMGMAWGYLSSLRYR